GVQAVEAGRRDLGEEHARGRAAREQAGRAAAEREQQEHADQEADEESAHTRLEREELAGDRDGVPGALGADRRGEEAEEVHGPSLARASYHADASRAGRTLP